jgi:hypothetical protein
MEEGGGVVRVRSDGVVVHSVRWVGRRLEIAPNFVSLYSAAQFLIPFAPQPYTSAGLHTRDEISGVGRRLHGRLRSASQE